MQWYYAKNGTQQGPVAEEELKAKLATGEISAADLAWREGMAEWLPIARIEELAGAVAQPVEVLTPEGPPVAGSPYESPRTSVAPAPVVPGTPPEGAGKATASMVLGICGLVFSCFPCLGLILGILATVFGSQVISLAASQPALEAHLGRAKVGRLMGIVAIVLSVVFQIAAVVFQMLNPDFQQQYQQ